jgi:hypothetical protein
MLLGLAGFRELILWPAATTAGRGGRHRRPLPLPLSDHFIPILIG